MPAIKATLTGLKALDKALKRAELRTLAATRESVDRTSRQIQLSLRADVGRIFTKNKRASNAVRRKLFDNKSRGTAALVFSSFGRREGGGRVRSNHLVFLLMAEMKKHYYPNTGTLFKS